MKGKVEKVLIVLLCVTLIFSIWHFTQNNDSAKDDNNSSSSILLKLAKGVIEGNKVFLVLLQNNMELRPGGGFIGSFAIIKTENGKIKSYEVHDTSNFDGRIPDNEDMPEPMKKVFNINSWKLRDSNYSPDFLTNAKKALEFYYQGKGEEKFDGVIAMNASVLERLLEVTGPVKLEGYPNVFDSKSALITLEKQVEIDFSEQGIERGDRKDVMNDFLRELLKKTTLLPKLDKLKLAKNLLEELNNKNLQLYFENENLQNLVVQSGWDGQVDKEWKNDYFMVVDANLGSYKSDYFIKRSMNYSVDMTKEVPEVILKVTYQHNGKTKDWMTRDYLTYMRLYIPSESVISSFSEADSLQYGEEFNKKVVGSFVKVPLNSTKTIEIKYTLPKELKNDDYLLKIQKQSGSGIVPVTIDAKLINGENKHFDLNLNGDTIVND